MDEGVLSVHRLGFKLKKPKLLQQFLPDSGLNGIFMMKHIVIIFLKVFYRWSFTHTLWVRSLHQLLRWGQCTWNDRCPTAMSTHHWCPWKFSFCPPLSDIFKVAHGNVQESDYIFGCPSSVSMLVLTHNATVLPSAKFWSCDRYTVPQTNFTARCIAHLHSL